MRKFISYILMIMMLLTNITAKIFAAGDEWAYINFASGEGQYIKAAARSASTAEYDGISAWSIPTTGTYYINCQVDNAYLYNYSGLSNISVKYYDSKNGKFSILYATAEGEQKYSETVYLTDSNKWKTHVFKLQDCAYNDAILSNDFRITLEDKDGRSAAPVVFAGASVAPSQMAAKVSCERAGHLFTNDEGANFSLRIDNFSDLQKLCSVLIRVTDEMGNLVYSGEKSVNVSSMSGVDDKISAQGLKNGFYKAYIAISSGAESYDFEFDFTIAEAVTKANPESIFGTCTHISGLKKDSEKMNSIMHMLKNSGVDYIRDEYYWDHVELEKGKYTFYADDYINACVENDIKPLVVLSYSNKFYGVPHNEEGYKAFAAYAAAVAEHLKGKVDSFEVWNEWNGGTWSGGYGIEEYANILKYTYDALKKVDKDINVVAGATITSAQHWFDDLFSIQKDGKSMLEYCDAISYHPYCFPSSPDAKKDSGSVEDNFQSLYNIMLKYGIPKPQWITEYGWFTGDASRSVTPKVQADYITRAYISGMAYGVEKIFIYDFKNDGADPSNSENNYGIIASWEDSEELKYAPKPSYLATAAAAKMLKDMDFVKEYRPKENIRMYKFQNTVQNREVYAIYSADDKKIPFVLTGNNLKLKCYDIYANKEPVKEISGSPIYIEGKIGEFDLEGFVTEFRTSARAVLGKDYKYDGIRVVGYEEPKTVKRRNVYTIDSSNPDIVFDIDDSWVYADNIKIKLAVDYYDGGSGSFYISYDGADGTRKKTDAVTLGGNSEWRTAVFETDDIKALNSYEGGDFKISANQNSSVSLLAVHAEEPNSGTPILSADFEDSAFKNINGVNKNYTADFKGMTVTASNNAGGKFQYIEKGGKYGVYVPAEDDGFYLSVNIDDDVLYGGFNDISVLVDYYDEGNGNFDISYETGSYTSQTPTGNVIYLENTNQWKTASFRLDKAWLENHGVDFRIALWTGKMPTSLQGITFGGIRVIDNKNTPSFNLEYDETSKKVTIDGCFKQLNDFKTPVTIQMLQIGKKAEDTIATNAGNVNETVRYFGEAVPDIRNGYKYFEKSFNMDSDTGAYLVRVRLPDDNIIAEKYFYYYSLYDLDKISIKDKDGNILDGGDIIGIDKVNATAEFLSRYDDSDICIVAAVYGADGALIGLDIENAYVAAGIGENLSAEIQLNRQIKIGDKIKIFVMKDLSLMKPLTYSRVVKIK